MGNCLRILGVQEYESDDEDANLLDPGHQDENSSESSDESSLLFRMLSTRNRRSRNRITIRDGSHGERRGRRHRRNRSATENTDLVGENSTTETTTDGNRLDLQTNATITPPRPVSASRRSRSSSHRESRSHDNYNTAIQMLVSPLEFTRNIRNRVLGNEDGNSSSGREGNSNSNSRTEGNSRTSATSSGRRRRRGDRNRDRRRANGEGDRENNSRPTTSRSHRHRSGTSQDSEMNRAQAENRNILIAQRVGLIQHLPLVSWSGKDLKAKINADSSNNHVENMTCVDRSESYPRQTNNNHNNNNSSSLNANNQNPSQPRESQSSFNFNNHNNLNNSLNSPDINNNNNNNNSEILPPSYTEKANIHHNGLHREYDYNFNSIDENDINPLLMQSSSTSSPNKNKNNKNKQTSNPHNNKSSRNHHLSNDSSSSKINPIASLNDEFLSDKEMNKSSDSDEYECTICLEDFQTGQNIRYLPCMHYYHAECIGEGHFENMRSITL